MTVIEAVREIIKRCPYLDEYYKSLGIDRLGKDSTSYSIESVPAQQILKRDIVGNTTRQGLFNFASREIYTEEVRQNLDNIGFFELFSDWLEQVTNEKDFPELNAGKTIKKIEAITGGYVFDTELDKAKYQIQCRIIYVQEARR